MLLLSSVGGGGSPKQPESSVYGAPASCLLLPSYSGTWAPLVRVGEEVPALPGVQEQEQVCASEGFLDEAPLLDPVACKTEGSI